MHGNEEATMATLSTHRTLVDELIDRHRGRIANTAGDSVLAEFASVLDAVHCAIEIQKTLANANEVQPEARSMRCRIGINVGDVMTKGGDIFGDGVKVAARLEGLVKGGEICVSRGVRDYLRLGSIASASATSATIGRPLTPSPRTSVAAASSRAALRAMSATSQPCRANSSAVARPTPALAPVTTTITASSSQSALNSGVPSAVHQAAEPAPAFQYWGGGGSADLHLRLTNHSSAARAVQFFTTEPATISSRPDSRVRVRSAVSPTQPRPSNPNVSAVRWREAGA